MSDGDRARLLYLAPEAIIHLAWRRVGLIPEVFIAPGIPPNKEENVRALYGIEPAEAVLVLLDDTAWGGGKDGAVLTNRRLCWREMFGTAWDSPWQELSPGDIAEADGEVRVKGEPISTVLVSDNVRPRLVSFLQEVIRGDLDDPHPYRQSPLTLGYRAGPVEGAAAISKHIAELVSEHMGDDDNIWAGPYIPERKLRGARKIHERHLPEDEEVLALYDDTVFGSAEEGFILTVRRLCWKNFTEHPRQVPWEYLPPEQILVVDDSSVGVGDCHIDVLAYTERPRRAAKLLREIRALFS